MHHHTLHIMGPWAFFIFGFFGSLHCLGMCAPLSTLFLSSQNKQSFTPLILYHVGRIFIYSTLGIIFQIGGSFITNQLALPIIPWILIALLILYALGLPLPVRFLFLTKFGQQIFSKTKTLPAWIKALSLGLITPLLPCGLLYGALLSSTMAPNVIDGFFWMFCFAFGTIPVLFLGQIGLKQIMRTVSPKMIGVLLRILSGLTALMLIWMQKMHQHY